MRIGVLWVGYQCEDLLEASLSPWLAAKAANLDGHEYVVACVSVPFAGFPQPAATDGTLPRLRDLYSTRQIDHLITTERPLKETEARGRALGRLVNQWCDISVMVDSDEIMQSKDISAILPFVEANPFINMFKVCLKNYVFDDKHYLAEPFTPPRIHRLKVNGMRASGFWDDNNVMYSDGDKHVRDVDTASMTIPVSVAWPRHLSWLSTSRSRDKITYQQDSRQWECSYRWDTDTGRVAFNEAYYASRGLTLPIVLADTT